LWKSRQNADCWRLEALRRIGYGLVDGSVTLYFCAAAAKIRRGGTGE
jgi:hypothetical protein